MATSPGIRVRHARGCAVTRGTGKRCSGSPVCVPTYEASVGTGTRGKKRRKTFATLQEAERWRLVIRTAVRDGSYKAPSRLTVRVAALRLIVGMRFAMDGVKDRAAPTLADLDGWGVTRDVWAEAVADATPVKRRGGATYKPSVIRSYESALRAYVLPVLGDRRVSELTGDDVRRFVAALEARETLRPRRATGKTQPLDASTVRNAVAPLGLLLRRAVADGVIAASPLVGVELPVPTRRRDRVAQPDEAALLISALPRAADRVAWALAFYAGLRIGEIRALRWRHVDLAAGCVLVVDALDARGSKIKPKSEAGERTVPIIEPLRAILTSVERGAADAYVAGRTATMPLAYSALRRRAAVAWRRAGLRPILPHEARHTFASWMVDSGVEPFDLSGWLGHANLSTTMSLYVHRMPDRWARQVDRANAYFMRGDTAARLAQVAGG
jgi:integrase